MEIPKTLHQSLVGAFKSEGFEPMNLQTCIHDPEVTGVFLIKGEFKRDKSHGLFIWDVNRKMFIEEPCEIDGYGFNSIAEVYRKYPGLRPQK